MTELKLLFWFLRKVLTTFGYRQEVKEEVEEEPVETTAEGAEAAAGSCTKTESETNE
jgi:hypothetical protein